MPKYTIEITNDQDAGLSHRADKLGVTKQELAASVLAQKCDEFAGEKTADDETEVIKRYRAADDVDKASFKEALPSLEAEPNP